MSAMDAADKKRNDGKWPARMKNLAELATRGKPPVGTTPADYLTQWRIALAQQQLRQGTSIKTTAETLGYANASSLSRVFTQVVGVSPRGWMKDGR